MNALARSLLFLSLFISATASALDCGDLNTQSEMNQCALTEYQNVDKVLNEIYNGYRIRLDDHQKQQLKTVQLAWIKFRDLACEFESSGVRGGSVYPFILRSCLARMTSDRVKELSVLASCEEGDMSCPNSVEERAMVDNPSDSIEPINVVLSGGLDAGIDPPSMSKIEVHNDTRIFSVSFSLPKECPRLEKFGDEYGEYITSAFSTRGLAYATSFCDQARMLDLWRKDAQNDFVSGLNFRSLSLDLVPYSPHCEGVISHSDWFDMCDKVKNRDDAVCFKGRLPRMVSFPRFVADYDNDAEVFKLDCSIKRVDPSCRFTDGVLKRSIVKVVEGVARCEEDPDGPNTSPWMSEVSLRDVSFRDVNGDGTMDAVLTISAFQLGTLTFVLTRTSPESQLEPLLGWW